MKRFKPRTQSLRNTVLSSHKETLTTSTPHKPLTVGAKRKAGRNHSGRITVRHQGGGHKRTYRIVDMIYKKVGIPAKVETIEYDPFKSAYIMLVCYKDGERCYHIAQKGIVVGQTIIKQSGANPTVGNRLPLKEIPVGTMISAVELKAEGGAKIARSAGSFVQVAAHSDTQTSLKMPSGEIRKVSNFCWATIGEMSNTEHNLVKLGKAGRSRWLGIRPTVRGSAMNPVDHPYGGGEGRQGRGTKYPKTMWGKITGGRKTRHKKKYSRNLIVTRRKVGKKR